MVLAACCLTLACGEAPGGPSSNFNAAQARNTAAAAWDSWPERVARIQPPTFPERQFQLPAPTDTTENMRPRIQAAIDSLHQLGGGKVILAAGVYHCHGPLHLRSNIHLHLAAGALLRFGDDPSDYLPLVKVRWEGTVCWNWSPLLYAYRAENIALTGQGEIDGNGRRWSGEWRKKQKKDQTLLRQMGNDRLPEDQRVFGNGYLDQDGDGQDDGFGDGQAHYLRPTLVEFYECKNILLAGLTLRNSPFWTVHPVFSSNISIRGLRVLGETLNDDGIDPDSCSDVLIEDCYVATHDDAISIKAGRDQDAWDRLPATNILVRNCVLASGVNAFCVGSEMSGGVHDVFVQDCHISQGKYAVHLKCNLDRGGEVSRLFIRRLDVDTVKEALFRGSMDYHSYRGNNFPTRFTDVFVQDVQCADAGSYGIRLVGVEASPITRFFFEDLNMERVDTAAQLLHTAEIVLDQVEGKMER
ncbi:glycoside hydrolase family 28 protein [Neolewinella lacunae]|uniref:Glycoside hydrolase family 28 protein n=1 Tax=Neolewinella lacunae TaxID=1517758 RepID=A0A923PR44_9BACT|nr:glycoside hydrolase family 28 protein [Neolewinella lacunae]MBC6995212.1 glycoside hydrolase family 28 protein [Neolewinella lacunae]MDN3635479.1 glycoside hydrolase family 28 protein [Neolewinella lacunae]